MKELAGKRVAVDGYAWLHKASYGCCIDLCTGVRTDRYISYCIVLVKMLLSHNIHVTIVFDGADLPAKRATEDVRGSNRKETLQKGLAYLRAKDNENARKYLSQAVDINPAMAAELIRELRKTNPEVQCIVAPYEADAQLAYLSHNNLVDTIISEDSDMIPFGCKDVVFKMEKNGFCQRLQVDRIYSTEPTTSDGGLDFSSFSPDMMICMCILSGCDYLSLKGFGIKNSYKLVSKHRSADKILRALRLQGSVPLIPAVPTDNGLLSGQLLMYELEFYKAWATFYHQTVYSTSAGSTVPLRAFGQVPLPPCLAARAVGDAFWDFLGPLEPDNEVAQQVASGSLHPATKLPLAGTGTVAATRAATSSAQASRPVIQAPPRSLKPAPKAFFTVTSRPVDSAPRPRVSIALPELIDLCEEKENSSPTKKIPRAAEASTSAADKALYQESLRGVASKHFSMAPLTTIDSITELRRVRQQEATQRLVCLSAFECKDKPPLSKPASTRASSVCDNTSKADYIKTFLAASSRSLSQTSRLSISSVGSTRSGITEVETPVSSSLALDNEIVLDSSGDESLVLDSGGCRSRFGSESSKSTPAPPQSDNHLLRMLDRSDIGVSTPILGESERVGSSEFDLGLYACPMTSVGSKRQSVASSQSSQAKKKQNGKKSSSTKAAAPMKGQGSMERFVTKNFASFYFVE